MPHVATRRRSVLFFCDAITTDVVTVVLLAMAA